MHLAIVVAGMWSARLSLLMRDGAEQALTRMVAVVGMPALAVPVVPACGCVEDVAEPVLVEQHQGLCALICPVDGWTPVKSGSGTDVTMCSFCRTDVLSQHPLRQILLPCLP